MQRIWTNEIGLHIGERVLLKGWLHRLRRLSNVSFIVLRDARGLAQIVLSDPTLVASLDSLHAESVISVSGVVVAEAQAPGGVEIHEPSVEVISAAQEPPPFDLFRPTIKAQLPTQLDHAPLALRHPRRRAAFQLADAATHGFRSYLRQHGFTEIQTPKIVGAATEGGANVFPIDYFGRPAYLSQSPQLYKQMLVGVFERVYEVGPAFRAEPHDTPRHINEFVSLDVEIGFIENQFEVMALLTEVLRAIFATMERDAAAALQLLGLKLPALPTHIPTLHFREAVALAAAGLGESSSSADDLTPAHERWLGEWALREHGSDFVFVWGYPTQHRAFYTHPDPEQPGYSRGFDLLFRGLELVSGAQRLHLYADYVAALEARGMGVASFAGYLEAFRHGMPPHGGFAIGLERLIARLLEVPNIREVTLFPRDLTRLTP